MSVKRFTCGQCPQRGEQCAEFVLLTNLPGPICHCGHPELTHVVDQNTNYPILPLKGGCPESQCLQFRRRDDQAFPLNARTLCVCNMQWMAHLNMDLLLPNTAQGADAQPFAQWEPPQLPNTNASTNDRRVEAMIRHRRVTPLVSSQVASGSGQGRSNRTKSGAPVRARITANDLFQSYKFDIGILGNPLMHLPGVNQTPYFIDRIWPDRVPEMLTRMHAYNLIIYASVDALPTDNLTTVLHDIIQQHFLAHHLVYPPSSQPLSAGSTLNALNFHSLPWKLVKIGYCKTYSNTATYQMISNSTLPYHSMTWKELFSNKKGTKGPEHRRAQNLTDRPLLWIAPRYGVMTGPINASLAQPHPCFYGRVFKDYVKSLPSDETDEHFECFDECPQPEPVELLPVTNDAGSAALESRPGSTPTNTTVGSGPTASEFGMQVDPVPEVSAAALGAGPVPRRESLFLPDRNSPSPPPPPTYNEQDELDLEEEPYMSFTKWWLEINQEIQDTDNEYSFFLKADNIDKAAQALIDFLVAIHSGQPNISAKQRKALGVKIQPGSTIPGLFFSLNLTFHVGEGTGNGVICAVLEAAIRRMVDNDRYWRLGLNEEYYSLAPRLESSDARRIQLKAFGSLLMVAIFHGVSPDPVSPFVLARIFQGDRVLENLDFIAAVAPETANTFSDWPSDDSPVLSTPKNVTLLANLEIQHRDITDYDGPQLRRLRSMIYHDTLVGKPEPTEMAAVSQGLSVEVTEAIPDISAVFRGPFGVSLIKQLYSRRVTDADQVLRMVEFESLSDNFELYDSAQPLPEDGLPNTAAELRVLALLFMQHLTRYLKGVGYPDHVMYHNLVPVVKRDAAAKDKAFRAQQFLIQITGMACLDSLYTASRLTLSFIKSSITKPPALPEATKNTVLPLFFRSCHKTAQLPVTMGLVEMLHCSLPDDPHTVTGFDLWIHQSVCPISDIMEGVSDTFDRI